MKRPTQKDVARKAGVSRSTVSYVLNDQTQLKIPISDETRQRVMDAIAELGYEPDARAQSLRSGSTNIVGVIIPVIQNPFFWQMLTGISDALQEAGYGLYLAPHLEDTNQAETAIRELKRHRVDGFILLAATRYFLPNIADYLRKAGRPIVEITATQAEFDHVIHGYASGTRDLMTHLFELGHKRIGFVYGVAEEAQGSDRLFAYREMLDNAGLSDSRRFEVYCGVELEDAYQAAYDLLNQPERPTALLVINDMLAVAVMRAAADMGLTVPDDLSVASFDDIPFSSYTLPRLTTVSGNAVGSGHSAVKLLLKRIAEPDLPQQVATAEVQLIIRESTGSVP
ncbi:LacI family DNA-binding transcriptional regulator [Phototrophicus methaneseepsis]|uniref:LacI family DNA-binding transcriptional regulator n=1 Tax=Phototrophicus methaneseepsis TaxID=2710758 RepID=A0A7S8IFQ7_9CHLR|nr:LacI family DNA-binding transcriptional regulator [Phototrophicus methaneseepsis]QPC84975.1 LacI family DNA-binding transcriptional regulator [Phototrophicus methaneseepsis]